MKYVTVANMNVNIVEHKGQRVLTTEQVADVYGCESRNISDNFKNNEGHFDEGKHYFKLEGAELKAFKRHSENIGLPINKFASTLYLWTRRGASRHCKMLGTEKAWEMFDCLEENYFSQQKPALPDFTDPVIAARAWADEVEKNSWQKQRSPNSSRKPTSTMRRLVVSRFSRWPTLPRCWIWASGETSYLNSCAIRKSYRATTCRIRDSSTLDISKSLRANLWRAVMLLLVKRSM